MMSALTHALAALAARPLRAALLCGAVAVLVYANALGNQFAYDDVHILIENPEIQDVRNLPGLLVNPYWPGEYSRGLGLWRPATTLSLGLQWALWQDLAWPYHLVNALAHGAATALVVLLLAALATVPIALLAGLVFAVHPVHVEAVANIVGLAEIQAAVFFLAACLLHLRAPGPRAEPGSPAFADGPALDPASRYGARRIAAVTALYLGAFLSKESAVTLPGVLFLLDAARERIGIGELRTYLRRRAGLFGALAAAAGVVLALRFQILGTVARPLGPLGADLLEQGVPRIWTVAGIWTHYVRLMVFPLDLSSDYSPDVLPIALGWEPLNLVGALLALGFLAVAWASWRRGELAPSSGSARLVGFGVLWFVIAVSPIANVFFLAGVLLAERTLYLPSVGAVAIAGWLLARLLANRRRAGVALTVIVLGLMSMRTWLRTPSWESMGTVFATMLRDVPQSGRSQWVLGDLFYDQGRVREALTSYRIAIGILGAHEQLLVGIAKKLMDARKDDAARFLLRHAWQQQPASAVPPGYLAISHFQASEWPEAERWARLSLEADPDQPIVSHLLAGALAEQGRYAEAIPWREHTIASGEGDVWEQWISLARLRLTVGDSAGARMARDSAQARAATAEEVRQIDRMFAPYPPPPRPL